MSGAGGVRPATPTARRRRQLGRRAQLLAGASVTYNLVEAAVAVAAGAVASSVALVGFGLDSLVEVGSGLVILWQFRHRLPETRERQALRLIALSFFALAAYVDGRVGARPLLGAGEAARSGLGIGLAVASLLVMPSLSLAQRRTGRELGVRQCRGRLETDPAVHVPVRRPARRPGPGRGPGLDVGRPAGRVW